MNSLEKVVNKPGFRRVLPHPLFLRGLASGVLLLLAGILPAQNRDQKIHAQYSGAALEEVLDDLNKRYGVRFAYSPEFIPLQEPIHLQVQNKPLDETLNQLFAPLPVTHQYVGKQVVLRYTHKAGSGQLSTRKLPEEVPQNTPLYTDPRLKALMEESRQKWQEGLPSIEMRRERNPSLAGITPGDPAGDLSQYRLEPAIDINTPTGPPKSSSRLAQISLLPYLGSNALESARISNRVSLNLLWGMNGGVEGLEVGGLVNTIRKDVEGIQIAGGANLVGDDVTGMQFGGVFNLVADTMTGVQIGGLFNLAGKAYAVQGAGLFNLSMYGFAGVQGAGLFNYCGGATTGLQAAGLFNVSRGRVKNQYSGLLNLAGDVEQGQVSSLLNVARKVEGSQIGLINFADTVSGVSLGLINIIKKGYNRVELGASETFFGNFALKLGVKRFYNIFYLGGRTTEQLPSSSGESARNVLSWGLGYGLGTAVQSGPRSLFNLEILSIHVNEGEIWTSGLNQLQQLRLTWDTRIGSDLSLYFGPTGNFLISRRKDPVSGIFQTVFAPYLWFERQREGKATHQFWGGLTAGIRI